MKTCIKLDEKDLKDIIMCHFRGLHNATVVFSVHRMDERNETSYSVRAEVTTEEKVIAY